VLAVVLVGGFGTRLRPLTETIPKQLLPVAGVAMIERVLAQLSRHGVDRAVLSMGYLPDLFVEAYPSRRIAGVDVSFAIEPEPLGTAGAVRFAALAAGASETFLAVNGDVLTDLDVGTLLALHRAHGAEGTIHLTPVEDPSRYGVVVTDADGRVSAFVEKPPAASAPSNHVNAGTYVLEPAMLDRVAADVAVSIETEVFPAMVDEGALYARLDETYWLDAGTPPAYLRANTDVLDGVRDVDVPGTLEHGALRLPGAVVAEGATVERSVLGAGARVHRDAVLRGAVLLDGAVIEEGASVIDSIVGPGATIGAGAVLTGHAVVGRDGRVPDGARLAGAGAAA
jgi:mannose-1-phosphate guanylyltransferase